MDGGAEREQNSLGRAKKYEFVRERCLVLLLNSPEVI